MKNKVRACFKALGFRYDNSDFEDRLTAQKIIYLLKLKGVTRLDFPFRLYLNGPYSRELASELRQPTEQEELNSTDEKKIEDFKEVFRELDAKVLEAAATYALYAFQRKFDAVSATKNTRIFKKSIPNTKLESGISKAKELLYKPTPKDLEEMKKEFSAWEVAAREDFTEWEALNN